MASASIGKVTSARQQRLIVSLLSAALVWLIGRFGLAAALAVAGLLSLGVGLTRPGVYALIAWIPIALVPEFPADIAIAPRLSVVMYRALVPPVSLADVLLISGTFAAMSQEPKSLRNLWHSQRMVAVSYLAFVTIVLASALLNGQFLRLVPLKPVAYMGIATTWGYALGCHEPLRSWIRPLVLGMALIVALQGLANALAGMGRQFAGWNLAFYDRASVFLIVVALLFLLAGLTSHPSALRQSTTPIVLVAGASGIVAVALSLRRTMWLALLLGSVVVITERMRRPGRARTLAAVLSVAVLAALAATWLQLSGRLAVLGTHVASLVATLRGTGREESIADRLLEAADALRAARGNLLLGAGPMGRYVPSFAYARTLDTTYVHNNYLWLLLHYGVLGLGAFAVLMWSILRALFAPLNHSVVAARAAYGLAVAAALCGLLFALLGDAFLTADNRWPLILGFLVGTALADTGGQVSPELGSKGVEKGEGGVSFRWL